ncbi:hypothetical protein CTI12_AA623450 [Artemisia annua]|uniref:Uncharacterized protein n=1 Tax=Artemisia annua TaxID=35608 RepID=A0A2U1K9E3_ARTAN|nr:hypothetical protein CTI12_AA623450 [Artemisia annua]
MKTELEIKHERKHKDQFQTDHQDTMKHDPTFRSRMIDRNRKHEHGHKIPRGTTETKTYSPSNPNLTHDLTEASTLQVDHHLSYTSSYFLLLGHMRLPFSILFLGFVCEFLKW